jgi:hypothetical protein
METNIIFLVRVFSCVRVVLPVKKREINGRGDSLRWPRDTLYSLKLALTSPTSGGRSVGIVRLRTKATDLRVVLRPFQINVIYINGICVYILHVPLHDDVLTKFGLRHMYGGDYIECNEICHAA